MAAYEKNFYRDLRYSRRHREYGNPVCMVDLDFVAVEYDRRVPVALFEMKHFDALGKVDLNDANYSTIRMLADHFDMGPLPFFNVYYWPDPDAWGYFIEAVNDKALDVLGGKKQVLCSEVGYVKLLYKLRGMTLPKHIEKKLNRIMPDTDFIRKRLRAARAA